MTKEEFEKLDFSDMMSFSPAEPEKKSLGMTREELIVEGIALATDYYHSYSVNDGKEIMEVFSEYFDLIKDEDTVSKKMMGAAMLIVDIHDNNYIEERVSLPASDMALYLHGVVEKWCPNYEDRIYKDEFEQKYGHQYHSFDYEELRDWIKEEENR